MGRNNTKAVKNISKMYEQLGLVQNDMFHKTIGEHLTRCDMRKKHLPKQVLGYRLD